MYSAGVEVLFVVVVYNNNMEMAGMGKIGEDIELEKEWEYFEV